MVYEEVKSLVQSFCERSDVKMPNDGGDMTAIFERMKSVGLLTDEQIETYMNGPKSNPKSKGKKNWLFLGDEHEICPYK